MIPAAVKRALLGLLALVLVGAACYSCGYRQQKGEALERDRAWKHTYDSTLAVQSYRIAVAEQAREGAEAAYSRQRDISDSLTRHVKARATSIPRIRVADTVRTDSLIDVCLGDPPECYPTPVPIAQVAQIQDSLLTLVTTQLIPQFEAERVQVRQVIDTYRMSLALEREAKEHAQFRVRQQDITIRALTPSPGKRRLENAKRLGVFVIGVWVGAKVKGALVAHGR